MRKSLFFCKLLRKCIVYAIEITDIFANRCQNVDAALTSRFIGLLLGDVGGLEAMAGDIQQVIR